MGWHLRYPLKDKVCYILSIRKTNFMIRLMTMMTWPWNRLTPGFPRVTPCSRLSQIPGKNNNTFCDIDQLGGWNETRSCPLPHGLGKNGLLPSCRINPESEETPPQCCSASAHFGSSHSLRWGPGSQMLSGPRRGKPVEVHQSQTIYKTGLVIYVNVGNYVFHTWMVWME